MMPSYLTDGRLWGELLPVLATPFLCSFLAAAVIARARARRVRSALFAVSVTLGLLGMAVGVMTALSRDPVVGAVMPAILTLFGGAVVYIIKPSGKRTHIFALAGFSMFVFQLIVGGFWGAKLRTASELAQKQTEMNLDYERAIKKEITNLAVELKKKENSSILDGIESLQ